MTTCPKCSYTRKAAETAPDWQCPSCGIAYEKFKAEAAALLAEVTRDKRERSATLGWGNTTSSGMTYLALVGAGIFIPFDQVWLVVLPLLAGASFFYWVNAYRRKRAIEDVPTSKVATAAQGYTELCGTVASAPGKTLKGPITNEPCVWYCYGIDENRGNDARTIEHGMAGVPFLVRDETGECLVNPQNAELLCEICQQWDIGNLHYSEWSIRFGDPVYVIGRFSSRTADPARDPDSEANEVMRHWLANPREFFTRFDANRDRKIGKAELEKARQEARAHVAQKAAARAAGINTMVAPEDGRPFIIMNMAHGHVESRFRELTVVHLVIFFIAFAFLTWNWR